MTELYDTVVTVKKNRGTGSLSEGVHASYDRALSRLRRSVRILSARDGAKGDLQKSVLRACDEVVKIDEAELPSGMLTHYLLLKHVALRLDDRSSPEDLATCAQWIIEMAEALECENQPPAIAVDPI